MSTAKPAASAPVAARSFVDLRAFAATAGITAGEWLRARAPLDLPAGPVEVAAMAPAGSGVVARLPADEFVIVLSGSLQVGGATVGKGRSVVIPAGTALHWQADAGTRAIVMTAAGEPGTDDMVPIDEAATLEPSGAPLAELLFGPTPSCRNHTDYRSASGEFVCGIWDSTPYHRRAMAYRHYELMHLLEGAVTFEDGDGRQGTFATGDVFLVEQGAECSWLSEVNVKKVYAIYRPA